MAGEDTINTVDPDAAEKHVRRLHIENVWESDDNVQLRVKHRGDLKLQKCRVYTYSSKC